MVDDRARRRKQMRDKLAELKSAALAELECRGYDVRGKTPAQIKQILKRRPSKQKSKD
jgi:xanthine/CO dehydrogenase XdhC/CoxF family maturation factor